MKWLSKEITLKKLLNETFSELANFAQSHNYEVKVFIVNAIVNHEEVKKTQRFSL